MPLPSDLYDERYFLSDLCEGWDRYQDGHALSDLKRREVELLELAPGLRVLDAGCGRGEVLLACAREGCAVAGLDYSEAAVRISRETLSEVGDAEIVHGDVTALPWPDASFDRALLGDVVEHLDAEQAAAGLAELRRVLRPGGLLVVHTAPNLRFLQIGRPLARLGLRMAGKTESAASMDAWIEESKRYHVNEQSPGTLRRALRRAGFADVFAWVDPDVLRLEAGHHLTAGLGAGRLVRLAGRVGGAPGLRAILGNDVYATGRRAA